MSKLRRCPSDKRDTSLNFHRSNMDTPYPKGLVDRTRAFRCSRQQGMGTPKPLGDVSHNLYGIHRVAPEM